MFKIGDEVTCKIAVEAHYSDYGGNPKMIFSPGMVGTIVGIVPKVRIVSGPDKKPDMIVLDYDCPVTGKVQRASLNFCNTVKL